MTTYPISTRTTGDLITAAIWNNDVVGVGNDTPAAKVTTKGDLTPATGANALVRLGVSGNDGYGLIEDAASSGGMKWAARAGIPEMVEPFLSAYDAAPAVTTFGSANPSASWIPIRPVQVPLTITALLVRIGVQSGNIDWGIYSFDGTTMTPVYRKGSTACPAAATKVSLSVGSVTLQPGVRYFFAFAADNNVMTISQTSGPTVTPVVVYGYNHYSSATNAFPLPAAIAASTFNNTGGPAGYAYMIGNCGGRAA